MSDPRMPAERILFLTGHLAEPRLQRMLKGLGATEFEWQVLDIGVKVAALMTEAIIRRRLPRPVPADRVIVPGRCRADLDRLAGGSRRAVRRAAPTRSPTCPPSSAAAARRPTCRSTDIRIFAEIVEASELGVDAILAKALRLTRCRRRRDRPRLPARHAVPASRGRRSRR